MRDRTPPRIGCVRFLNARPLIHGWPGDVLFENPSSLCRRVAAGELDVALVSSFEYLRNPIYRIVDDVAIGSDGPVFSVVVAYRGQLEDIAGIELDPASETSVNLLRCLLARRGMDPRLVPAQGRENVLPIQPHHAQLLIGDNAIRSRRAQPDCRFWDLGQEWKEVTNLPFVFALWLVRPEVRQADEIARRLRACRDQNLKNLEEIIKDENEFPADFCRNYYRDYLRFFFAEREKSGLRKFAELCLQLELIPKVTSQLDLV